MLRFYPGLSVSEALALPAPLYNHLWEAITILEAQEHIALTKALIYPSLVRSDKSKRDKKLYADAYPKHVYPPPKKAAKDIKALSGILGGDVGRRK